MVQWVRFSFFLLFVLFRNECISCKPTTLILILKLSFLSIPTGWFLFSVWLISFWFCLFRWLWRCYLTQPAFQSHNALHCTVRCLCLASSFQQKSAWIEDVGSTIWACCFFWKHNAKETSSFSVGSCKLCLQSSVFVLYLPAVPMLFFLKSWRRAMLWCWETIWWDNSTACMGWIR